jgi:transcriptional regulator with XRE-family HTH domain
VVPAEGGGTGGARDELARRLRAAMTARGWRRADLARESGVSTAMISSTFNRHSTPSVATLEALADVLGFNAAARAELFRLREAAEDRVRRLDDYLDAALRAAREHPYPGVLPGLTPPLTDVYVNLEAENSTGPRLSAPTQSGKGRRTAQQVISAEGTCVLVAGPGGGKSSLLRSISAETAEAWQRGFGGREVPVLVRASALGRAPLALALAEAASADLAAHGLVEPLHSGFFATPPRPGARWLVLVDGLDEVLDPQDRRGVAKAISAVCAGPRNLDYRFVVATRPSSGAELDEFGAAIPHYTLLPFSADDIGKVAEGWLRALHVEDAESGAGQFIQALAASHLADAARTPLMASILCQLYAAAPDSFPPQGRGQLYREFVALLRGRTRTHRAETLRAACDTLARYSTAARSAAEHVLDHLDELTAEIAYHIYHGLDAPAVTLAEALRADERPAEVSNSHWRVFLHAALSTDGLLTERGGELEFLHQTLLEHLAARHAGSSWYITKLLISRLIRRGLRPAPSAITATRSGVNSAAVPEACAYPRTRAWIAAVSGGGIR